MGNAAVHTIDITAHHLRMARAALGWTQEDLAEASGISRVTIANLELGKIADARIGTLRSIVNALEKHGVMLTERGVELTNGGGAAARGRN
jgi:transcriptional regulator with XRE-family HTH domain